MCVLGGGCSHRAEFLNNTFHEYCCLYGVDLQQAVHGYFLCTNPKEHCTPVLIKLLLLLLYYYTAALRTNCCSSGLCDSSFINDILIRFMLRIVFVHLIHDAQQRSFRSSSPAVVYSLCALFFTAVYGNIRARGYAHRHLAFLLSFAVQSLSHCSAVCVFVCLCTTDRVSQYAAICYFLLLLGLRCSLCHTLQRLGHTRTGSNGCVDMRRFI